MKAFLDAIIPRWVLVRAGRYINRRENLLLRATGGREAGVTLPQELLDNCRVMANRNLMLDEMPKGGVVMELGVNEGEFSAEIMKRIQPAVLHLVDPWASARYGEERYRVVQRRFEREIEEGRVAVHRMRSEQALEAAPDGGLDWIYIDSTHKHETTTRELELGRRKVKPETGMIAGHDYTQGNVDLAYRYGVVSSVNAFCRENGWEFLYLTNEPHRHVSFVIRQKAGV